MLDIYSGNCPVPSIKAGSLRAADLQLLFDVPLLEDQTHNTCEHVNSTGVQHFLNGEKQYC